MFTGQNMIELKQERISIDDHLLNNDGMVWQSPLCAWCLSEQGMAAGDGSHGICTTHATWLLKKWKEHRRRRHQS